MGVKSYVCQWLFMIIIIGQFLLISCGGDSEVVPSTETQVGIDKELIQTYLSENAITAAEDESGIYYYPLIENATGNSQQVSGSILSIYY